MESFGRLVMPLLHGPNLLLDAGKTRLPRRHPMPRPQSLHFDHDAKESADRVCNSLVVAARNSGRLLLRVEVLRFCKAFSGDERETAKSSLRGARSIVSPGPANRNPHR